MAEGVGDRPVNLHQKVLDQRLGAGFILNKRFQKPVDAADVHWEMGHRRHMVVEDEQVCDSLQQGSGRGEAQELAALPEEFFIIRQDIAGAVRGVALKQVADDAGFL